MKRFSRILVAILMPLWASAEPVAWDTSFRDSGKIYVVIAVALLILLVLLFYMIKQDRSLSRLEKQIKEKK